MDLDWEDGGRGPGGSGWRSALLLGGGRPRWYSGRRRGTLAREGVGSSRPVATRSYVVGGPWCTVQATVGRFWCRGTRVQRRQGRG
ncbi:extensin [Iris pallida]|uniref:Extensin n=1 Tax=Iris pallida TaxID=29817 RepID=A0AAX6GLF9_IRIPA|nr:extensin [Iris pallida]